MNHANSTLECRVVGCLEIVQIAVKTGPRRVVKAMCWKCVVEMLAAYARKMAKLQQRKGVVEK